MTRPCFSLFVLIVGLTLMIIKKPLSGSLYNPHVFPNQGPFFEGWYIRFTDSDQNRTFGFLFGKVVPEDTKLAHKLAFMGLIYDDQHTSRLLSYDAFPSSSTVNITVRGGQPVTSNPEVSGPAYFRFEAGNVGYIKVKRNRTEIKVNVNGTLFEARIGESVPWDPEHKGPMGWLVNVPIMPLYWFVYSTRSPLLSYKWQHPNGDVIEGKSGLVHMEKNWGPSFPSAWIWTQGVTSNHISYAIAFGPLGFGPVTLSGHLGGYKNPNKDTDISFRPDNSKMSHTLDPCSGSVSATVDMITHKIQFSISAKPATFSCLYGPMTNGFRRVSTESFKATAKIEVYKRFLFWTELIDTQEIYMSALEFGGYYMCKSGPVGCG